MLIVALERTRVGALGLVVGVVVTSAAANALGWDVATVRDLGATLGSLPNAVLPELSLVPSLIVPAVSLALVGLVQGAGISANFPNADGSYPDPSRDFIGQGVANIASGALEGMPVGGSVSGTSVNKAAGARTRTSLVVAGIVMAVVLVAFGDAIENIAMPALAALLILVGYRTIKPRDLASVWRTGVAQRIVLVTTFALTMAIPLQYAVVAGVALSVALYVVGQSNHVTLKRRIFTEDGHVIETDPPARLPANDVVVLQPYGSLFFAAAPIFEADASRGDAVVAKHRRDPASPGTQRRRLDLHRRPPAVRGRPGGRRIETRHRVAQRAARRAVPRHRIHRIHRPGEPLPRQRASRRRPRAGATRCAGMDRDTQPGR